MSSFGPTGALADAMETAAIATDSYRVCNTVVLICLASASTLIVLMVAFCFRHAFASGYAAATMATNGAGATAANSRSRCGLAPSALSAIPKLTYRRDAGAASSVGWVQCAICLTMVQDGETLRLLPACGHLFHIECIDLWLRSHATAPICQRDVVEAPAKKV
ncbi:E3 ubiquitin-protein ligase EL5-like [Miscanthus floridulus]|uniref:E3 ubiquitin-protein ligase EL5-like n=1 Tax=Miscanthus floridulus TaxID=154761 RepID=UPI003459108D